MLLLLQEGKNEMNARIVQPFGSSLNELKVRSVDHGIVVVDEQLVPLEYQ
jgi:hypothetical protein